MVPELPEQLALKEGPERGIAGITDLLSTEEPPLATSARTP